MLCLQGFFYQIQFAKQFFYLGDYAVLLSERGKRKRQMPGPESSFPMYHRETHCSVVRYEKIYVREILRQQKRICYRL